MLLTTDVPSSQGTAAGAAPPAACRSDSAGDRQGRAGLRAARTHGEGQPCHLHPCSTRASKAKGLVCLSEKLTGAAQGQHSHAHFADEETEA